MSARNSQQHSRTIKAKRTPQSKAFLASKARVQSGTTSKGINNLGYNEQTFSVESEISLANE